MYTYMSICLNFVTLSISPPDLGSFRWLFIPKTHLSQKKYASYDDCLCSNGLRGTLNTQRFKLVKFQERLFYCVVRSSFGFQSIFRFESLRIANVLALQTQIEDHWSPWFQALNLAHTSNAPRLSFKSQCMLFVKTVSSLSHHFSYDQSFTGLAT